MENTPPPEKAPRPKKPSKLGPAGLALIAGLANAGKADAQSITPYDLGGVEHTQSQVDKQPKDEAAFGGAWVTTQENGSAVSSFSGTPEDMQRMHEYTNLLPQLQGLHLSRGDVEGSWQGYTEFCKELSMFCDHFASRRNAPYVSELTPELYADIADVNQAVNTKVQPIEDIDLYGVREKWTIPDTQGDCEDYVILKILKLIEIGIDPARLHILVVNDETGTGHAVLGVDVRAKGAWNTLVLDNRVKEVIPVETMEKRYLGRYASFVTNGPDGRRVRLYEYTSATP